MGTKKDMDSDIATDYHPIALTPIIMKCFERLVIKNQNQPPTTLDPLQFAYRPNRSKDDAFPPPSTWLSPTRKQRLLC